MNSLQLSVLLNAIDKMSAPIKGASKSVGELSKKLRENKAVRAQLSRQERQHAESVKKYASTLNPLKNNLAKVNQELLQAQQRAKHYTQQLAGAKNPTAEFTAKVEKANATVKILKAEQGQAANKLRQAREQLKAAGLSAQTLAQRQTELGNKTKAANQQIKQQELALSKLNAKAAARAKYRGQVESLKSISGKAQILGAQSLAAGATVTAPVKRTTTDFMSFEDAMIGVARQVQGLKDDAGNFTPEFDAWKIKIQELSKELPLTTVQIANMIESAARMDIAKEELEDFVRLNTQMAIAFDAQNPDELVDQFGKVSKNFKLTIADTKDLADTINWLDDNAISKGTGIIGYMNRVAGISGIAKISAKNMAALGSTLQTLGAEEEDSATAVTTIFTRLGVAGNHSEVDGGLKKLGLDPQKIAKGMASNAQDTLMLIVERIKKLKDEDKLDVMKGLVGIPHIKTISKLVDNTEEWRRQIALANDELAKNSMSREFQTRMKALSASTGIFQNRLFNLSSTIGGTLAPTLKDIMSKAGDVVDKFKNWIEANPELASKIMIVVAAVGGALTAFGGLSLALSFLVYPIARVALGFNYFLKISKGLGAGVGLLAKAFAWFGATAVKAVINLTRVMFANPIIAIIMLIIGALILLWQNWDTVKESLSKGWAWLSEQANEIWTNITNAISEKVETLKNKVGEITDSIGNYFNEKWNGLVDTAKNFGSNMMTKLKDGVLETFKDVEKAITDSVNWIKKQLGFSDETEKKIEQTKQKVSNATANAMNNSAAGRYFQMGIGEDVKIPEAKKYTGGYAGNGGKYEPKGVYHGGEYIMTKETTSRLGVPLLNALNYGKNALLATGLSMSVATAAPIQVDSRPPLVAPPAVAQSVAQPMAVNITINAAPGQDERAIARMVAQEMQRIQNQQQARQRSSMRDRD
nr:MAG TPA: minor tail protein [Caudoviricetes sp.]